MTRRPGLRLLALTVAAAACGLLPVSKAEAVSQYLRAFNDRFGTDRTRVDTCGLCHVSFVGDSAGRNSFGEAFESLPTHAADPIGAFADLESTDPDQDGTLSGNEIAALFMPGWSCNDFGAARNAPTDLFGYVDPANPGCGSTVETACFDGTDDDLDGLVDCADPDCEASTNGTCSSGEPGICSEGTITCSESARVCLANQLPATEGPVGDPTCTDGLDNDCDALLDDADSGCQELREAACGDGVDNDADGAVDCADPDCQGAVLAACETSEPGICTSGELSCSAGQAVCLATSPAEVEAAAWAGSCTDGFDNDCDGLTDDADPDCQQGADVYAIDLRAPKALRLRLGRSALRRIVVTAHGGMQAQEITASLEASPIQGATVELDPGSMTRTVEPGGGAARFRFEARILCNEVGTWLVEWTAQIRASQVGDPLDEVLTSSTRVVCR